MIDRMQQHFGFTTMPFGRDLAPGMLHRHAAHAEAAARITWTITEKTLGVITGEVGTGKTVAVRAALAAPGPNPAHRDLHRQPRHRRPRHPPPHRHQPSAGGPPTAPPR